MNPQHVVSLNVSNVKRLSAIRINLDAGGRVVVLAGENSAGKSSVLDAIEMALCGKASIPGKPIRSGAESAKIVLETEDLVVTRTFTATDSYIKVEGKDGRKYGKPQELLETLISRVGFNPLRFSTLPPTEQAAELLRICPAPIDLDENARRAKQAEEERRDANRDVKRLEAQLEAMPPAPDGTPDEEISIADASEMLMKATRLREGHRGTARRCEEVGLRVSALTSQIVALQHQREALMQEGKALADEIKDAPDHEARVASCQKRVQSAERTNAAVRASAARRAVAGQLSAAMSRASVLQRSVECIRAERERALAEAKFPVDGLSIDPGGVITYKGEPFAQAGTADKILVGVGLAMADNPTLRVISIPDGDKVYAKGREQLDQLAAEHDLQIWMEREVGGPSAVVIVDGTADFADSTRGRPVDTLTEADG